MALEVREAALESAPEPSSVLDAIACPVLVLSLDGTLLDLNRAAAELLGLEPAAARGKSAWDLPVPRNLRAAARDVFAPGLAGRLPVTGEAAWKERRIAWTLRAAGTAVVATGTDVTDQAAEARRLEQERDFAMQVIGALGQGVAVEGADWRLHYVNPAFARMAGRSPDEV
ncbi:MAG TPA: PAS domain-containing protein, partial [Deinococcales bacterium]|nr:PAS domain-containing protein [Deinococcales bacterium]